MITNHISVQDNLDKSANLDDILQQVEDAISYRKIAKQIGVSRESLIKWLNHPDRAKLHASAILERSHNLVDDMLTIADDSTGDIIILDDGTSRSNPSNVQRAKLQIDTRKWMAQVINPVYRDKQVVEVDVSAPLAAYLHQLQSIGSSIPISTGRTIDNDDDDD